jgi:integrase
MSTPLTDRYKHHRFPAEIISHGVWLYFRFCLSYHDVEELLLARGMIVTYEAIRKRCRKFGQSYANELQDRRPRPGDKWHLDEVFLTINGRCMATTNKPPKPKARRGSGTMQFLTQDGLKRLFAVIKEKRDKALFLLAYRHGLRASEIGLLQRTDLDLKQGRITILRLEGSLSGIYPLQPDVIKLLRS